MTPYFGLPGGVSPGSRSGLQPGSVAPDSLSNYFPANLFGGPAGRQLSNAAKTLQHHRDTNPFNPFGSSRAFQGGPPAFNMDAHMAATPMMPHAASAHGFGFGSLFGDVSGMPSLSDQHSSISPIKFGHHSSQDSLQQQQQAAAAAAAAAAYNGRAQHMFHDMSLMLGSHHQHAGAAAAFDPRTIGSAMGPPFHGHPAASFGMGTLNFPMHNI